MKEKFIENFADALEVDVKDIEFENTLDSYEGWDSIASLTVIAFADSDFNKTIDGDDISDCKTVEDLYNLLVK